MADNLANQEHTVGLGLQWGLQESGDRGLPTAAWLLAPTAMWESRSGALNLRFFTDTVKAQAKQLMSVVLELAGRV